MQVLRLLAVLLGVLRAVALNLRRSKPPTQPTANLASFHMSNASRAAKLLTADPQLSCLDGKRIVFVGPSTSRLDYLALTYFAEFGVWPDKDTVNYGLNGAWSGSGPNPLYGPKLEYGMQVQGKEPPAASSTCRSDTASQFLWYSNHILNGHEVCDCYKTGGWRGAVDVNNQTENRVYDNGRTTIAYFQWLGDIVPPRGSFSLWPLQQKPRPPFLQQCPAGQWKGSWDWVMPLQQFLTSAVAVFQPTHLVIDAAFWPIDPANTFLWEGIAQAGVTAVLSNQGKVLWRTTPVRTDYAVDESSAKVDKSTFLHRGWKLFDASGIISQYRNENSFWYGAKGDNDIFYDNTHLRPEAQCYIMKNFLHQHVCPLGVR